MVDEFYCAFHHHPNGKSKSVCYRSSNSNYRSESTRNSRRRRRSVQVSKLFMANIYAVYCAVKLVLLRKGRVMCDIFKETVLFLK